LQFVDPLLAVATTSQWHSVRRAALQALQQYNERKIGEQLVKGF